jgi:small GTP-binding protein
MPVSHKFVVLSDTSSVGKTALVQQLLKLSIGHTQGFGEDYTRISAPSLVGISMHMIELQQTIMNPCLPKLRLQVWDTSSHEMYQSIVSSLYSIADVIIMIFDVNSKLSFNRAIAKLLEVRNHNPAVVLALIGNKIDIHDAKHAYRQITFEQQTAAIEKHNIHFTARVSALTGMGVSDLLESLVRLVQSKHNLQPKSSCQKASECCPNESISTFFPPICCTDEAMQPSRSTADIASTSRLLMQSRSSDEILIAKHERSFDDFCFSTKSL